MSGLGARRWGWMTDAATIDGAGREGAPFPFRDLLVARTYEPRADAAATLVARAIAERMAGVAVIRAEGESLDSQAQHAALTVVGTPLRRAPAAMPGGDASLLARRLGVPVVVVPRRVALDLAGLRSLVCGVRDERDAVCVNAAGALADALDLQLVLVHVMSDAPVHVTPLVTMPAATARTAALAVPARRAMVAEVAARAGRLEPGAACLRIAEGPAGPSLRRAGREERAALVAVGASRRRPLAASILGSVARDVRRKADRPVLVCPHEPAAALRLNTPA
jgi:nucleotide-binding universal stress UspA family protein